MLPFLQLQPFAIAAVRLPMLAQFGGAEAQLL